MATKQIAVIGSLNIDFITRTPRVPAPGETLTASSFDTGFGGKGANQAVACARLAPSNTKVHMVGNVGADIFGKDYFAGLEKEGINASGVRSLEGKKTGVANIIVDEESGENRILFTANANFEFGATQDLVPEEADVVVLQLEIPMEVVLHNLRVASEKGKHVVFNPAPATKIPRESYRNIDTLILNETESAIMSGTESPTPEVFLEYGVREVVIITLGGEGLVYATADGRRGKIAAQKVKVVDTTAAGDTFVGAYAVKRAQAPPGPALAVEAKDGGFGFEAALRFATLAAGKAVGKMGAMDAIPYLRDVQE